MEHKDNSIRTLFDFVHLVIYIFTYPSAYRMGVLFQMVYSAFLLLFFVLNLLVIISTSSSTTASPFSSFVSNPFPLITHFLVFSSDFATMIRFEPKRGWILNEEKKFRLYLSGVNLQNSFIAFSSSDDECKSNDYISPIYSLSSAPVIELNVELQTISKPHSLIYVCLLISSNISLSLPNNTELFNATQLRGAYFTFLREKSRLSFSTRICLILMLFIVSGFFRYT